VNFNFPLSWGLSLVVCTVAFTATVPSLGQAQTAAQPSIWVKTPVDLKIQRQQLKASLLHEGMSRVDVEKVMGKPTDTKTFPNLDTQIEILSYRQEPIITKVSMIDGVLSGVTTELKTITENNLPGYAQVIKVGMSRQEVIDLMGQPLDERHKDLSIFKFEQLTFRKGNDLPVNVMLRDDRVDAISIGLEKPPKLLGVILPAEPSMPKQGSISQRIIIGLNPKQVTTLFGQPTFVEHSEVQKQMIVNLVYAAINTDASTRFTFTNNVLTRFSFVPQSTLYQQKR
jgi:outer membrane protein assembly factor BamE (lipoprotein component of BamABCDE complex)